MRCIAHINFPFFVSNILLFSGLATGQINAQAPLYNTQEYESPSHRIAIIGAGAGGSSAAYYIAKFYNETLPDIPIEIAIFESNSYVGGRTTTVEALDDPRYPTELGGSIFVEVNHVLYNLTKEFGLSTKDKIYESTGSLYDLGIWDGSSFVYTIDNNNDGGWYGRLRDYWDIAKLLWKYGLSPIRTRNTKDVVVSNFLKLYDEYFPIASLTNFAAEVGLGEYTSITGDQALLKNDVSVEFAHDIVQSSTRVNYAQNLNTIHGLETMVCMAIEGAMSINGGNWRIFDQAIKRSGAKLHLNTSVTDISRTSEGSYRLQATTNRNPDPDSISDTAIKEYDTVVLASPYQFSNITFTPPLSPKTTPPKIDYVTLHVTLFTSPFRPSPAFFGLTSQEEVPDSVLTTLPPTKHDNDNIPPRGSLAVGPSQIWSLSTLRVVNQQTDHFPPTLSDEALIRASKLPISPITTPQYLYKIFSPAPLTASFLTTLFAFNHTTQDDDGITSLPPHLVSWSHIKTWQSYPYLPPTETFAALLLDSPDETYPATFNALTRAAPDARNARGVFYTSGVESFISTMETSAVMGRNVARVIVDGLKAMVGGASR